MAAPSLLPLLIFLCISISLSGGALAGDHNLGWIPTASTCTDPSGECFSGDDEFAMDTEINRRILATNNYISYGALQRNRVPCSRRGVSYYNCRPGAQANPYRRGCSAITRCRRS